MNDALKAVQMMGEGFSRFIDGVTMLVRHYAETVSDVWNSVVKLAARTLGLYAAQQKGREISPRVTHLAFYAKKKRTRKKNMNRLKKILQER